MNGTQNIINEGLTLRESLYPNREKKSENEVYYQLPANKQYEYRLLLLSDEFSETEIALL